MDQRTPPGDVDPSQPRNADRPAQAGPERQRPLPEASAWASRDSGVSDGQAKRPDRKASPNDQGESGKKDGDEQKDAEQGGDDKQDADEDTKKEPQQSFLKRHPILIIAAAVVLIAALIAAFFWWLNARHFESTDDAFVDARQFAISPKVGGYITEVPVTDNEFLTAGTLVVQIDKRDYENALAEAEARRKSAGDQIVNVEAQIAAQNAQVEQAQQQVNQARAALQFAQQQFDRAQTLVKSGAGTVQNAQQQQSNLLQAQADRSRGEAAVAAAEKQILVLQAQRQSAVSSLSEAKAERDQAQLNLDYTAIRAAQPGRIAKLSAAKGQYVVAGQNLTLFVPEPLWVTANFKETQITDMRPGQPVDIRIDAYPDRKLKGHVDSVQPGSGTAFSLLPAQNATGNYVKVVQRIPVKIVFDDLPKDVTLGPGMSVLPTVRVR